MTTAVLWLRRDLRLGDHPALAAAQDCADEVVPLFVLDDVLLGPAGAPRRAFLFRCLRDLQERTGGALRVLHGRPQDVLPDLVRRVGASNVHISTDAGPYGRTRDAAVAAALGEVPLLDLGSPYAVTPGSLTKADASPYRVFSPFFRAWQERGVRGPAVAEGPVRWTDGGVPTVAVPDDPDLGPVELPEAGERAGLARWREFADADLADYAEQRNRPDADRTSQLSVYLKYGCVHPRTLLSDLGEGPGPAAYRRELAFRDFYADVLWHAPDTARDEVQAPMSGLSYDTGPEAERRWEAWVTGTTGYPIVDAGMRQLAGAAWMHNRMRMVTASFLTKDLHLHWRRGAAHFLALLRDGDLPSNQHGWQWVAGTGTDPSPYFRVFNPVRQGREHDPDGAYVRRWVPELRDVAGAAVHEPWLLPGGVPTGYPERVVNHADERVVALERYAQVRG
ncbi:MAG: deoxyribodipyrimidine photolyase [Frankiales bacterium]|jgi:deoxyribodipyrimidine photo-lyase|nr:deoxyribodipyrimidine photolyase [Frankiales bacterium]